MLVKIALVAIIMASFTGAICTITGCAPRTSIYCIKDSAYVKCPKGIQPGTDITKQKKKPIQKPKW